MIADGRIAIAYQRICCGRHSEQMLNRRKVGLTQIPNNGSCTSLFGVVFAAEDLLRFVPLSESRLVTAHPRSVAPAKSSGFNARTAIYGRVMELAASTVVVS
jgi:hypothetical protein